MLDFRTETFLTVCEYMNYTKAAEVLNMTQPAISGHIRFLESYYGTKLFSYCNKKLSLTTQGEHLKRSLQTLVHDEIKLKCELSQIKPVKIYRIGATLSIGDSYLPKFLSDYLDTHKDTELSVTVANTATLLKKLEHGLLDIVLSEGYFSKDSYDYKLISEEPLSIFCGINYNTDTIHNLEDLFSHRLISREQGSGTRAVFEHYLTEQGYCINNFKNKCDFTSLELITQMLTSNQGISILYKCVGINLLNQGKLKEIIIPNFSLTHNFNALWQKNSMYSYENEAFVKELKDSLLSKKM